MGSSPTNAPRSDEVDASIIKTLCLDEVVQAYDAFVMPNGSARRKLSMHLVAHQTVNKPSAESTLVREEGEPVFKDSLARSATAVPVTRDGPSPSPML